MARILYTCFVLLFIELTIGTKLAQELTRVPRQLNINGTECCPCPKNNSLSLGRSLSDGDSDNSPLIVQPDLDAVPDSSFGAPSVVRVPAADCPCKAGKVGSSRKFLGKSRLSQSVEPDSLFNPEVNLAHSILGSIHEVSEQEYQEALARKAARARSENEGTNDQTSEEDSVDIPNNLGNAFNYAKTKDSDPTPVFIITVITDTEPITNERITSDETASSNQETIVEMPILDNKPGNTQDPLQSSDKISNSFSDDFAKIVPALPEPPLTEVKLGSLLSDTSKAEVIKDAHEATDVPLLQASGTLVLSQDLDQMSNSFSKQDTSHKEENSLSTEQKNKLMSNPIGINVFLTDSAITNNEVNFSDLLTSNASTKMSTTEIFFIGDSQDPLVNDTKESFQDVQNQKHGKNINVDLSEPKEVVSDINVSEDCEGACNEPIPSIALHNSTQIGKSLLKTVNDMMETTPEIQKVLEQSFQIPMKVLEQVSKGHNVLKESKLTSIPKQLSDEFFKMSHEFSKMILERPEALRSSASILGSRRKYAFTEDPAKRKTNLKTNKNNFDDQRSIKYSILGKSSQQSLVQGKQTSEPIKRKPISEQFSLRSPVNRIGMISENAEMNKNINKNNFEALRFRGNVEHASDKTKLNLMKDYKSQDNNPESMNLNNKFFRLRKDSVDKDRMITVKDPRNPKNRLSSVYPGKESETAFLKKTDNSDSLIQARDSLSPEQIELLYTVLNEKPRKVKIGETKIFNQPSKEQSILGQILKLSDFRYKSKPALSYESPEVSDVRRCISQDGPATGISILGQKMTLPNEFPLSVLAKARSKSKAESENSRWDRVEPNQNLKSTNERNLLERMQTARKEVKTVPESNSSKVKSISDSSKVTLTQTGPIIMQPVETMARVTSKTLTGQNANMEPQDATTIHPIEAGFGTHRMQNLRKRIQITRERAKSASNSFDDPLALDSSRATLTQESPAILQPVVTMKNNNTPKKLIVLTASEKNESLNASNSQPFGIEFGTQKGANLLERIQTARGKLKEEPASDYFKATLVPNSSMITLTQEGPAILQPVTTMTTTPSNKLTVLNAITKVESQDATTSNPIKVEVSTRRPGKLFERIQTAREKSKSGFLSFDTSLALGSSKVTFSREGPAILQTVDTIEKNTNKKLTGMTTSTTTEPLDAATNYPIKIEFSTRRGALLERIQTLRGKAKAAPPSGSYQETVGHDSSKVTVTQVGPAVLQPLDTMTDTTPNKTSELSISTKTESQDAITINPIKVDVSTRRVEKLRQRIHIAREEAKSTSDFTNEPLALDSRQVTLTQAGPIILQPVNTVADISFNQATGRTASTKTESQDVTTIDPNKSDVSTRRVEKLRQRIQTAREKAKSTSDFSNEPLALDSRKVTLTQEGPIILQPVKTVADISFNQATGLTSSTKTESQDVTTIDPIKIDVSTRRVEKLRQRIQTAREKAKSTSDFSNEPSALDSRKVTLTQEGPIILQPVKTVADISFNQATGLTSSTKTESQDVTTIDPIKVDVGTRRVEKLRQTIQAAREKAKSVPDFSNEPLALDSSKVTLTQAGPAILQPVDTITDNTPNIANGLIASTKIELQDTTTINPIKVEASTRRVEKLLQRIQTAREKAKSTSDFSNEPLALDSRKVFLTQEGPIILQPINAVADISFNQASGLTASKKTESQYATTSNPIKVETSTRRVEKLRQRIQTAKEKAKSTSDFSNEPLALDSRKVTLTQESPIILQPVNTVVDISFNQATGRTASTKTESQDVTTINPIKVDVSTRRVEKLRQRLQTAREKANSDSDFPKEPLALDSRKETLTQAGPIILQPVNTVADISFNQATGLTTSTKTESQDVTTINPIKVDVSTQRVEKLRQRIQTAREKAKSTSDFSNEPLALDSRKVTLTQESPIILQPINAVADISINQASGLTASKKTESQYATTSNPIRVEASTRRVEKLRQRIQTAREKAKSTSDFSNEPLALDSSKVTLTQAGPIILQPVNTVADISFNQATGLTASTKTESQDVTTINPIKVDVSTRRVQTLRQRIQTARGKVKSDSDISNEPLALDSSKVTLTQAGPALLQPVDTITNNTPSIANDLIPSTKIELQDATSVNSINVEASTRRVEKLRQRIQTVREKANSTSDFSNEPLAIESSKVTLTQAGPIILQPVNTVADISFKQATGLTASTKTESQDVTTINPIKVDVSTRRVEKLRQRLQTAREKANSDSDFPKEPLALDSRKETLTQEGPFILQPVNTVADISFNQATGLTTSTKTESQDVTTINPIKVDVSTQRVEKLRQRIQTAREKAKSTSDFSNEPLALDSRKVTLTQESPIILQPINAVADISINQASGLTASKKTESQYATTSNPIRVEASTRRVEKLRQRIQTAREKAKSTSDFSNEPLALDSSKVTLTQAGPIILQPVNTAADISFNQATGLTASTKTESQDVTTINPIKVDVSTRRVQTLRQRIQTARGKVKSDSDISNEPLALDSSKVTLTQAGPIILQPVNTVADISFNQAAGLTASTKTESQDVTTINRIKIDVSTRRVEKLRQRIQTAREKTKSDSGFADGPLALDISKVTLTQVGPAILQPVDTITNNTPSIANDLIASTKIELQDATTVNPINVEASTRRVEKLRQRIQTVREKAKSTSDFSNEPLAIESSKVTLTQAGPIILQPVNTVADISFNQAAGLTASTKTESQDVTTINPIKVDVSTRRVQTLRQRIQTAREKDKSDSDISNEPLALDSSEVTLTQAGPIILQPVNTVADISFKQATGLTASNKTELQDVTTINPIKVDVSTRRVQALRQRIQTAREKAKSDSDISNEPLALDSSKVTLTQAGPIIQQPLNTVADISFNQATGLTASTKTESQDVTTINPIKVDVRTRRVQTLLQRIQTAREEAKSDSDLSNEPLALDSSKVTLTQAGPLILQPVNTVADISFNQATGLTASTKTESQDVTTINPIKVDVSTRRVHTLRQRIQTARGKVKSDSDISNEPLALDSSKVTLTQAGPIILQPVNTVADISFNQAAGLTASTKTESQDVTTINPIKVDVSTRRVQTLRQRIQTAREKAKSDFDISNEPLALDSSKVTLTQAGPLILQPVNTVADISFNQATGLTASTKTESQDVTTINPIKVDVSTRRVQTLRQRIQTAREKDESDSDISNEPLALDSSKVTLTQAGPIILQPVNTVADISFKQATGLTASTKTGSQDVTTINPIKVDVSTRRVQTLRQRIQTAREKDKSDSDISNEPLAFDSSKVTLTQAGPIILQPVNTVADISFKQATGLTASTKTESQDVTTINPIKVDVSTRRVQTLRQRIQTAREKVKSDSDISNEPLALDSSEVTLTQAGPIILQPVNTVEDISFNQATGLTASTKTESQDLTTINPIKVDVSTRRVHTLRQRIQTARGKVKSDSDISNEPLALDSSKVTLTQAGPIILQPVNTVADILFNQAAGLTASTKTESQDVTTINPIKVDVSTRRVQTLRQRIQTAREKAKSDFDISNEPLALDSSKVTLTQAGPLILQPVNTVADISFNQATGLTAITKTESQDVTTINPIKVDVSTRRVQTLRQWIQTAREKAKSDSDISNEPLALDSSKVTLTQAGPIILQPVNTVADISFNQATGLTASTKTESQDVTTINPIKVDVSNRRVQTLRQRIQTAREKDESDSDISNEPLALDSSKVTLTQAGPIILQPVNTVADISFKQATGLTASTKTGSQDVTTINPIKVDVSNRRVQTLRQRIQTAREKDESDSDISNEPLALDSSKVTLTQAGPIILQPVNTVADISFKQATGLTASTKTGSQDVTTINPIKVDVSTRRVQTLRQRIQTAREKDKSDSDISNEPLAFDSSKVTLTQAGPIILQPVNTVADISFNQATGLTASTKTESQDVTTINPIKVDVSNRRVQTLRQRIQTAREKDESDSDISNEPLALDSSKVTLTQAGPIILQPVNTVADISFKQATGLTASTKTGSQDVTTINPIKVDVSTRRVQTLRQRIQTAREKDKSDSDISNEPLAFDSSKVTLTQAGPIILQPVNTVADISFKQATGLTARTKTESQDVTTINPIKVDVSTRRVQTLRQRIQTAREKVKSDSDISNEPLALDSSEVTLTQAGPIILQPVNTVEDISFNQATGLTASTKTESQDVTTINPIKVDVSTRRVEKLRQRIQTAREKTKSDSGFPDGPLALDISKVTLTQVGPAILQPVDTITNNTPSIANDLIPSTKIELQDATSVNSINVEASTRRVEKLRQRIQTVREEAKSTSDFSNEPLALDFRKVTLTQAGPIILQPVNTVADISFNQATGLTASTKTESQDITTIYPFKVEKLRQKIQTAREEAKSDSDLSNEPLALESSKVTLTQAGPIILQPVNTVADISPKNLTGLSPTTKTESQDGINFNSRRVVKFRQRIQTARERAKSTSDFSYEPLALDSSKITLAQVGPAILQPVDTMADITPNNLKSVTASTNSESQKATAINPAKLALDSSKVTLTQVGPVILQPVDMMIDVTSERASGLSGSTKTDVTTINPIKANTSSVVKLLKIAHTARVNVDSVPNSESSQKKLDTDSRKDTLTQEGPAILQTVDTITDVTSNKETGLSARINTETEDENANNPMKLKVSTDRGVNLLQNAAFKAEAAPAPDTSQAKLATDFDTQDETTKNPVKAVDITHKGVQLLKSIQTTRVNAGQALDSNDSQDSVALDFSKVTLTEKGPDIHETVNGYSNDPAKTVTILDDTSKIKSLNGISFGPFKFEASTRKAQGKIGEINTSQENLKLVPTSTSNLESLRTFLVAATQRDISTLNENKDLKELSNPNQTEMSTSIQNSLSKTGIESDSVPSDSKIVTQTVPEYILGISKNSDLCPQVIDPDCYKNDGKVMKEKKAYKCTMVCEEVQK